MYTKLKVEGGNCPQVAPSLDEMVKKSVSLCFKMLKTLYEIPNKEQRRHYWVPYRRLQNVHPVKDIYMRNNGLSFHLLTSISLPLPWAEIAVKHNHNFFALVNCHSQFFFIGY